MSPFRDSGLTLANFEMGPKMLGIVYVGEQNQEVWQKLGEYQICLIFF